jgi:DNA gyrase subunit A
MAVRFDENHVRPMGRAAYGVNGINLEERDYVVGMTVTPKPDATADHAGTEKNPVGTDASPAQGASVTEAEIPPGEVVDLTQKGNLILSVTENGYGKRTPADEYRLTNRAGKGVINVKTTERVGKVVAIALVDENSQVMLISQYGKIIRMDSKTIREVGRNSQGVRLLHMEPGDRVAAAVVLAPEEEPPTNGGLLQ